MRFSCAPNMFFLLSNRDFKFSRDTGSYNKHNWNRLLCTMARILSSILNSHCLPLLCHSHLLEYLCHRRESFLDSSLIFSKCWLACMRINSFRDSRKDNNYILIYKYSIFSCHSLSWMWVRIYIFFFTCSLLFYLLKERGIAYLFFILVNILVTFRRIY